MSCCDPDLDVDAMLALALLTSRAQRPAPAWVVCACIALIKTRAHQVPPACLAVQAALDRLEGIGLVARIDERYALTLNAAVLIAEGVLDRGEG